MEAWTCSQCGFSFRSQSIVLPVRCVCGAVDTGSGVVASGAPTGPPLAKKIHTYAIAASRWVRAGRPVRSDEQVAEIFHRYCEPCERLRDGHCSHPQCGCAVSDPTAEQSSLLGRVLPAGLVNKLRMATERCPEERW